MKWKCTLCDFSANEYNWLRVFGHITKAHKETEKFDDKEYLKEKPPKEKEPNSVIKANLYFGRIKWCDVNEKWYCTTCNYMTEAEKGKSMNSHIAAKHKEFKKAETISCPYCPLKFTKMNNLNTHILKKRCPNKIEEDGGKVWRDIVEKNNVE